MDKKMILVVEDEADMAEMLKFRLEANGYDAIFARDGEEALDKARNLKPDLIVLDLMLPKMDGYQVCSVLKSDSRYKDIPIIILTARAQKQDIKLGGDLGADAYVAKPFDPKALLSKIKEFIRQT